MSSTDNEPGTNRLSMGCGHKKIFQSGPPLSRPLPPLEAGVRSSETDLIVLLQ
jgi:hypothetical protein